MSGDMCESCAYFFYDEEYECYVCDMDLDEDELGRFIAGTKTECPYYRNGDEYEVVKHQN
ncbi:MAG: hypothetical protein IJ561_02085 [Ruminococcus sp.]|nr:hypothetical protein [Ruminococcus sp.]